MASESNGTPLTAGRSKLPQSLHFVGVGGIGMSGLA